SPAVAAGARVHAPRRDPRTDRASLLDRSSTKAGEVPSTRVLPGPVCVECRTHLDWRVSRWVSPTPRHSQDVGGYGRGTDRGPELKVADLFNDEPGVPNGAVGLPARVAPTPHEGPDKIERPLKSGKARLS